MVELEAILNQYKTVEDLQKDFDALNSSGSQCMTLWGAVRNYLDNKKQKDQGVLITTRCGEEHHVEPTQKVETITLNGEQVYPAKSGELFKIPQSKEDVERMLNHVLGGEWRFDTCTGEENMDYFTYVRWLRKANIYPGCKFTVPANPHDLTITPYAFMQDGTPYKGYSLYIRKGAKMVKPKEVLSSHFCG